MNQLQSQPQSPRESNFDFEELPQHQERQINENKITASIFTEVFLHIQALDKNIGDYLFNIVNTIQFLHNVTSLCYNFTFSLGSKTGDQQLQVSQFIQISQILNDHNCCLELFWGILSISYYVIVQITLGLLFVLHRSLHFPYSIPHDNVFCLYFVMDGVSITCSQAKQKRDKCHFPCKLIAILQFNVFCKLLLTTQLMLINFRQINWLKWDWIYIFSIFWVFLILSIVLQFIFLTDLIVKLMHSIQEKNLLSKQALNQEGRSIEYSNSHKYFVDKFINSLYFWIINIYYRQLFYKVEHKKKSLQFDTNYNMHCVQSSYCRIYLLFQKYLEVQIIFNTSQFLMNFKNKIMDEEQNEGNQFSSPSSKRISIFTRDKNKINIKLPQFLIKLSQTYFQPYLIGQNYESQKQMSSLSDVKQAKRNKTDVEQPKQSNQNSLTELKAENDQNCFNCYQNESCAVYMPCGHGGLCIKCATEWFAEKQECLICRKPVEQVVKVIESNSNRVQIVDVVAY
ncbi:unnamed protein product (macronuclear) [Paramecium tetraurelia]|uniref:RING-type domain-containing protein n=1 Tax=Paramecium tetraurelia TaxID=5888 RepID=A0D595_PARTE|nr:uncharacterized protein GSPATT00013659001 [Paramecium tetraurelia]CAK78212.1 unnamed protein product [Paramecium tetraurelia]|eukprot:XP_001445609.1 hypothetical protein (macronuclear) [Paramecium tetraurelia strain d4-2]